MICLWRWENEWGTANELRRNSSQIMLNAREDTSARLKFALKDGRLDVNSACFQTRRDKSLPAEQSRSLAC